MADPVRDLHGRPFRSLRISVTDRCNLRCGYCMPEASYAWLPRESLLTFDQITGLVAELAPHGVRKIRLTGGEPLLRPNLAALVASLRAVPDVDEIALTTNGVRLREEVPSLVSAGLDRITVSLDTLRPERMRAFARSDRHADVLGGIEAAREAGLDVKLNAVIIRGYNDDEIVPLLDFARDTGAELRYIEYMDVGGATGWSARQVVTAREMRDAIRAARGAADPMPRRDPAAPASDWVTASGQRFGIVASTSTPFCRDCDRGRLTADGVFFTCLYAADGLPLREVLRRDGARTAAAGIMSVWSDRRDRGAEERAALPGRTVLVELTDLRRNPHREMHVRGG